MNKAASFFMVAHIKEWNLILRVSIREWFYRLIYYGVKAKGTGGRSNYVFLAIYYILHKCVRVCA